MDASVLDRQQERLKWVQQQQHFQQLPQQNYVTQGKFDECYARPQFNGFLRSSSMLQEMDHHSTKACLGLENIFPDFSNLTMVGTGFLGDTMCFASSEIATCSVQMNSRTSAHPHVEVTATRTKAAAAEDSFKKRKAEFVGTEDSKDKRIKGDAEEVESKVTEKRNKESSTVTSKENSKVSEVQKPEYIHVRARRGQATDSHSLAERARREKISKKMKCLQDLVPGCNKITGKAGMLDEIINYVQSLQRQVEFLSMKLAALNPMLDFNTDSVLAKEFPAHIASFQTAGMSSAMGNFAYLQFNPGQHEAPNCGLNMPTNLTQTGLQSTSNSSVSVPEIFAESSCFSQNRPFSTLETDMQSLYTGQFH